MRYKIFSVILLLSLSITAQPKNSEAILESIKKNFMKIEDYQVDVKIKVDVYFLKMPDREATIFYKQPDKIHITSDGFALLPKEGINFSPLGLLNSKYTAFYEKVDTLKGIVTSVIKIIPLESSSDVILSTLWIDERRNLIMKIESSRKPAGTFIIDFDYLKTSQGYWLPSTMAFNFSVDQAFLPKGFNIDMDSGTKKDLEESKKPKTGTVYLYYSNYKVNTGLSDEIFDSKDVKK